MAVARVTEIIAGSKTSFDDAITAGIKRVGTKLEHVSGAWVKGQKVVVEEGTIVEYRVQMDVTFILNE